MFELSVAFKYLTPRWRQLSVSIISLISILVIALVVWLVVVFFSVTNGLEKSWIQKLISLTAPIRITPTDAYYHSYYYQIDGLSEGANYTLRSIQDKQAATESDLYDQSVDGELPAGFPAPDFGVDGSLKDLVKRAYTAIGSVHDVPGISANAFEMTSSNLRLRLLREQNHRQLVQSYVSQAAYIVSLDPTNPSLRQSLLPISIADLNNLLENATLSIDDDPSAGIGVDIKESNIPPLKHLFNSLTVRQLRTTKDWVIPKRLLPHTGEAQGIATMRHGRPDKIRIPLRLKEIPGIMAQLKEAGLDVKPVKLRLESGIAYISIDNQHETPLPEPVKLLLPKDSPLRATLVPASLDRAKSSSELRFTLDTLIQDITLQGETPLGSLEISKADIHSTFPKTPSTVPFWLYELANGTEKELILPSLPGIGDGILLPKGFREAGIRVGDRGYLSYQTPTFSAVQEQRLPIFVAGFYDPGIIPIGGKLVLANRDIVSIIRGSHQFDESPLSNGINVRFDQLDQADHVKEELEQRFELLGIAPYWHIETFREFDFTKDLIQQLRSERNLWSLLATVIIIVACSNIISMLIILVNDKKIEIGILRAMGASSFSIAIIFGFCGMMMGMLGSVIGMGAAFLTLKHLQALVDFIGWVQGHQMFNPIFYGNVLPNEISLDALLFVIITTSLVSLVAGVVPAIKACLLRPSTILKAE